MRRIDRLISLVMWGIIGMSVPVMAVLAHDRSFRSDWPYTIALCSVWVLPALSLAHVDDTPHAQPVVLSLRHPYFCMERRTRRLWHFHF